MWQILKMSLFTNRTPALALMLALGGCLDAGAPGDDEPPIEDMPIIEVGTGTYRFEPVPAGGAVPLVFGAQGGWHIWVAIRVHGVSDASGSFEVVHYPLATPDAEARVSHGIRLDPPNALGWRSYVGWPAILRDAACAVGGLYRVQVTFRPASGGRLTASHDVLIEPGEIPPPPCVPE